MDEQKEQIKEAKKGNMILFGSNREIRRLPLYLSKDEIVHKIITGSPGKKKGRGIIVVTDVRILFIKDGWVFRTIQDFPYETISSVEFKTGIFFGIFAIYAKGDETAYNWVGRFAGAEFAKVARQLSLDAKRYSVSNTRPNAVQSHPEPTDAPPVAISKESLIEKRLEELHRLHKNGSINLDDYEIQRQKIFLEL